jgi:hypothetical protein
VSSRIRVAHPEKLVVTGGADDEKAYLLIKRRLAKGGGLDAATELSAAQLAVLARLNKSLEDAVNDARETELPASVPVIYSELGVVTKPKRRSSSTRRKDDVPDAVEGEGTMKKEAKDSQVIMEKRDDNKAISKRRNSVNKLEKSPIAIVENVRRNGTITLQSATEAAEALRQRLSSSSAAAAGGRGGEGGRGGIATDGRSYPVSSSQSSGESLSPLPRIRYLQKQLRLQDEVLKTSKSGSIENANAEAKKTSLAEELATLLRH